MNDADDALSRIAHASTGDPSGALAKIRHIMSNEPEVNPTAAFEVAGFTKGDVVTSVDGGASLVSTCSKVWWGFWHFLQRWNDLHCLIKCPERKQFIQTLFAFNVKTILSCESDLNFGHAYTGCFSLHTTQLPTGSIMLEV